MIIRVVTVIKCWEHTHTHTHTHHTYIHTYHDAHIYTHICIIYIYSIYRVYIYNDKPEARFRSMVPLHCLIMLLQHLRIIKYLDIFAIEGIKCLSWRLGLKAGEPNAFAVYQHCLTGERGDLRMLDEKITQKTQGFLAHSATNPHKCERVVFNVLSTDNNLYDLVVAWNLKKQLPPR
jgi:hypothetical protein